MWSSCRGNRQSVGKIIIFTSIFSAELLAGLAMRKRWVYTSKLPTVSWGISPVSRLVTVTAVFLTSETQPQKKRKRIATGITNRRDLTVTRPNVSFLSSYTFSGTGSFVECLFANTIRNFHQPGCVSGSLHAGALRARGENPFSGT